MTGKQEQDYRVTTLGVYDPPEPDESLPEGLLRDRQGPVNRKGGRRASGTSADIAHQESKPPSSRNAT